MNNSAKLIVSFGLFLAPFCQPAMTHASVCEVGSAQEFQDTIGAIKNDQKKCIDEKGIPAINVNVVNTEKYLRWEINAPIVVDTKVHITSSGRQSIVANFAGIQTCMMHISDSDGVIIDNLIFLNNKSVLNEKTKDVTPASNAVCIMDTAKNVTFKNNKIIGDDSSGILVFNSATITNNRIKVGDGVGIVLMGSNNIIRDNTIDALPTESSKFGIGILVLGLNPSISGNKIYALKSVWFLEDNPILKRSDAANIVQTNPSLLYDKTGEYDEELPANNNFSGAYAKFCAGYGCSGDLLYCSGLPTGTAPYIANEDSLICIKPIEGAKKEPLNCPTVKIECPLSGKIDNGVCIIEKTVEKIIEKPVPGESVKLPGEFKPIVANPGDGGGNCSLAPDQALTALTPVGIFILTISMTGLAAYRSSLKTQRVRGKKE